MLDRAEAHAGGARQKQWRLADTLAIGLGCAITFTTLDFGVLTVIKQMHAAVSPFEMNTISTFLALSGVLVLFGPIVVLVERRRKLGDLWIGIEWNSSRTIAMAGILIGIVSGLLFILIRKHLYGGGGSSLRNNDVFALSLYVVSTVLLQPFLEEIYFRGILFVALARWVTRVGSISLVTVIFVFFHPMHHIAIIPIAVILGIVRLKSNSLAACFTLHASYNATLLTASLLGK